MPAQQLSPLKRRLAMAGITMAAVALFLLLRPDVVMAIGTQYHNKVKSPQLIQDYLASAKVRKLQLGAGTNNFPGWLNTDITPHEGQAFLDATKPFPLPDGSVHYIFAEHVVEHISYTEAQFMISECRRVLAPGGKIRLVTPNLDRFIALFAKDKSEELRRYMARKTEWHDWPTTADQECYILNLQLREWGHQFVYTPRMLISALEKAGFRQVKEFNTASSGDPGFCGLDVRANSNVQDINLYEAMAVEGTRE